jgi:hypothetical protein
VFSASRDVAGDPETVIGILEIWRNAGAGGAASYFDVVAPRSSAGGFARTCGAALRTWRVAGRRDHVVVRIVPIATPFVDIVANVIEAERVGSIAGDWFGTVLPTGGVVGKRLRRIVAPGKLFLLKAAAGGALPFGLCGEAEGASCLSA